MKKQLILFILNIFFVTTSIAQRNFPLELQQNLQGKTKVVDIMKEVNKYYDFGRKNVQNQDGVEDDWEGNDYHWWKKWEYWAMRRMNKDGELVNHRKKNYQAQQQVDTRFGNVLRTAEQEFKQNYQAPDEFNNTTQRPTTSYGGWTSIGPFSGGTVVGSGTNIDINGLARLDRISFHPTNANIMYTGSPSGSIYKTINGGTSWEDIGRGLPLGVACLKVAPSNGNVIYAFSGDGDSHYSSTFVFNYDVSPISSGLFKSTDGGTTWTKCTDMYTGANDLVGHNLTISQSNSNFLLVATDQGLYRTTDGGNSWTLARSGNHYDVVFRPYDDSTVYASTASSILNSSGGGRTSTWNASTLSPAPAISPSRIDLAVRNNNLGAQSTYVYALLGGASTGVYSGIYLSTDVGLTYNRQSNSPNILGSTTAGSDASTQARYDLGICVHPVDVNRIATAGLCVWRSNGSNGGTSMIFSSIYREGFGAASSYIHPDIHDVQYNPLNNYLFACTDGGVYRSIDDGVTWTNISNGLEATQFYHMKMKDSDGDGEMDGTEMIAGAQDNGIKYRTSGGDWRHILCCDGFDGVIKGSSTTGAAVMTFNGQVYSTPNGGTTMNNNSISSGFAPMAIDYDNDDTLYIGGSGGLRRSYNGGSSYTTIATDVNNILVTCPSNNARLYGSGSSKTNLRISEDRGTTWATISGNAGWPTGSPVVTDCKPWPTFSGEIYTSFAGYNDGVKVYRSLDAGVTWANYSGSLPNVPVHSMCVAIEGVYAGTEIGVFFRADGAADWTPFYAGMPTALVTDIWASENGLVYASTFGHGVWIAGRYTSCTPTINITGTLTGNHYYEAGTTATSTANSIGGVGTKVFVKSNGTVQINPGFQAVSGTFFKAWIGPCGTGGIPTTDRQIQGIMVPHLTEVNAEIKHPEITENYYKIYGGIMELNIKENCFVEMLVRNNGKWTTFYPKSKFFTGLYALPQPSTNNNEIIILVNGNKITNLTSNINITSKVQTNTLQNQSESAEGNVLSPIKNIINRNANKLQPVNNNPEGDAAIPIKPKTTKNKAPSKPEKPEGEK
jgi:photosystem II stability/assembly factor-like uncharacterized protein